ncbi:hypothetical protein VOLCADRAFT_102655 [Volvox carteri f. nagariensis]|uniref:Uncharacterized protein n=1 Tax=Volvox carteri f. nagariensis TaxID=3068 RepID=D8THA9_VOLCA|nr:uncharacterized protein VOLCADRAFT_102655 [Volvox carteri f. nagariensis]EFJ53039.1 hypothetical protein VOLCADRAFT_102655 [Volvox carteri f. nagariensis]|eukprot:XP_002946044.1 hypothetical protein VOLCADRAFT_102655 [Volvox carteri f. nagariensis]
MLSAFILENAAYAAETAQPCCSISACSGCGDQAGISSGNLGAGIFQGTLWHSLPILLQERHKLAPQLQPALFYRGISTTSNTLYKFDSHLTRYNKAKVVNRDNFQRFRDSGRDARVAADILREGEHQERRGSGGGWGRGGRSRSEADEALLELRSMVHDCRDLRAMQVLVRECANDLDIYMVCSVLGRLPQLKRDTPEAAAPEALARRVAEMLVTRLEPLIPNSAPSNLAHALVGLATCGLVPPRSLLTAVASRLAAAGPHGGSAAAEADAKAVSKLLSATAKLMELAKQQQGPQRPAASTTTGVATGGNDADDGDVGKGQGEGEEVGGVGEVLRSRLWPLLRAAAEVKLLRALGEEPPGGGAGTLRRRHGGVEEVEDDSMPQTALRFICMSLALARETHPGTWTAAGRLAARHAAELQPAVAASVLRSYAMAGGASVDGGKARLMEAVWDALGRQVEGLEVSTQLDLLIAALKLAAAKDAGSGGAAAQASAAAKAVPVLCGLLTARVPALNASDASHLIIALAELHTKTVAAAAAAAAAATAGSAKTAATPTAWQRHSYGTLPRLLADLLVLRGVSGFGASKFASAALGLGLMGYADPAFWQQVSSSAAPEVPRMDGTTLSRLLGAFHNAALAAEAAETGGSPGAAGVAVVPGPALLAAAHARIRSLLDCGEAPLLTGKALFHLVRAVAEWPLPEDGGLAMLRALSDKLLADDTTVATGEVATAPAAVRQRLVAALRRAGLGEHTLVTRLASSVGQ